MAVDQVVCGEICAWISTEYYPASESVSEAANVSTLPDSVIRMFELGPATVS